MWGRTYLNEKQPDLLKDCSGDVVLDTLDGLLIEICGLARQLSQQPNLFLIADLFLQENLLGLCKCDGNESLYSLPT